MIKDALRRQGILPLCCPILRGQRGEVSPEIVCSKKVLAILNAVWYNLLYHWKRLHFFPENRIEKGKSAYNLETGGGMPEGEKTMLNIRKTRLMTKLALYETGKGKEDIRLSKYYKSDYVRLQILKTILAVTVGYLLILLLVALYKSEYLIAQAVNLDYKAIGTTILVIYVVLLTIYIVGAIIGYSIKYDLSRGKLTRYFRMLKVMKKIYREEEGSETAVKKEEESNG